MVISGRSPGETVFGKVLDAVRAVRAKHDLKICACLGLLNAEQVQRLKAAGVETINHNLNTSANFTQEIVSTHTFDDRVGTVQAVKDAGMKTCSGGILGMGESDDDVIDLALSLRELDVKSVPVNFLIPVPGTSFAHVRELNPRHCLRILCLYRFLLPTQEIRISGGREVHLRSLQAMGLYPANSIFIGDYLTTQGQTAREDMRMIEDAGFVLETPEGRSDEGRTCLPMCRRTIRARNCRWLKSRNDLTRHAHMSLADLRTDYRLASLSESDVNSDPIAQFNTWFAEAQRAEVAEPNAMVLSTSTPEGFPSARVVLLKGVTDNGFVFYTDYRSRKGQELEANPRAALCFFWQALERQVRITGVVQRVSREESRAYFDSRPVGSRIGATASVQSSTLANS